MHSTTKVIYDVICEYWIENKYSPSYRDIVSIGGLSTPSIVHYHIQKLKAAGLIEQTKDTDRSLCPTNMTVIIEQVIIIDGE